MSCSSCVFDYRKLPARVDGSALLKQIIFYLAGITILFSSCEKGPPPVSVTINALTINGFPTLDQNGEEWDIVDGADLYFAINEGSNPGNFLLTSPIYSENAVVPVNFTHGFPFTIDNIHEEWTISLWDYDNGNDDDLITFFHFVPNDYYVKGRNTINLTGNAAYELNVIWNF